LVVNIATNETISQETFTYDAAGNIIGDNTETTFVYDTNNRLTSVGGQAVTYDLDGNMLSCGTTAFTYDSSNRLITAGGNTYTYNAEDIRVRNLCGEIDTTYAYNTNARLSQLLQKTTNGVVTKYVYGVGLIGEETGGIFKTYHFDMRGSTTAITDMNGNVTDTFKYDTYGKLLSRTGTSDVIFLYNGRDGVVTDSNGLLYMRARYYSPVLRRFINADILHGEISDSTSLNRYAYVNGNPVSFVDPFGLWSLMGALKSAGKWIKKEIIDPCVDFAKSAFKHCENLELYLDDKINAPFNKYFYTGNNNSNVADYTDAKAIDSQEDMARFKLGEYSIKNVGCEVVAVYNVMVLSGQENLSFLDTIKTFEEEGAMIYQPFMKGSWGSNPYSISRVLDAKGIEYDTFGNLNTLKEPGVYIVSYWWNKEFNAKIHTVCVTVDDNGEIDVLNGNEAAMRNGIFITGYEILGEYPTTKYKVNENKSNRK